MLKMKLPGIKDSFYSKEIPCLKSWIRLEDGTISKLKLTVRNLPKNSKDTLKYTKSQLALKKKNLQDLYQKLTNYKDEAALQFQRRQQELIEPIQQKAIKAIQDVAKENGYTCILAKEQVYAFPSSDDVLALTKRKLGIK